MPDNIWETFDALYRTVLEQGRRVRDLEAHIVELEQRLRERAPHLALVVEDKPLSFEMVEEQL